MAETAQERRERLSNAYDKSIAGFVYGVNPRPTARYTFDIFGRKSYVSFEDYLNG